MGGPLLGREHLSRVGLAACLLALVACGEPPPAGSALSASAEETPREAHASRALAADLARAVRHTAGSGATYPDSLGALAARLGAAPRRSPLWPASQFMAAELHRLAGAAADARVRYRGLISWAAGDPYGDGWGGSSLAAVALWRWLSGPDEGPASASEVERVVGHLGVLRGSRLVRQFFEGSVLSGLPQLEERVARDAAVRAHRAGLDEARALFVDFLAVSSSAELDPVADSLLGELLESGTILPDRLALMRGRRLARLGRFDGARTFLGEAKASGDPLVRSEASLVMARMEARRSATARAEELLADVLAEAAHPRHVEEALYRRSRLRGRDPADDVTVLLEQFPDGEFADDGLYVLARHHLEHERVTEALELFARLRDHPGAADYANRSRFLPALALYERGTPGDLREAVALLDSLVARDASGPLAPHALFWAGRLSAELGDEEGARRFFERTIATSPWHYYALRARMHLSVGSEARRRLYPDSATRRAIRDAYLAGTGDRPPWPETPYHRRLGLAVESGLYGAALDVEREIRARFPSRRLEDVPLEELDASGLLPRVALLASLRQDALAAKDVSLSPGNRLAVAEAVGHAAGDHPLMLELVIASRDPPEERWAAQGDVRYLATAYPPVLRASLVESSRPYDDVSPEMLYAVARHESLFFPAAFSRSGALGLFQFMPQTFRTLCRRWGLLDGSCRPDDGRIGWTPAEIEYLVDPGNSVALGARYFQHELLDRYRGQLAFALMDHNAGGPAVSEWRSLWRQQGRESDLEFVVETIGAVQTRVFMRSVLATLAIVDAAEVLDP